MDLQETAPLPEEDLSPEQNLTGDKRTEARLCAVQALYQVLLLNQPVAEVQEEYLANYLRARQADKKIFQTLFAEATSTMPRLKELVASYLADSWTFERLSLVEQALLLTAVAELAGQPKTPVKVVINEFLDLAHSFFEEDKVSYINAVLDRASHALRGEELNMTSKPTA